MVSGEVKMPARMRKIRNKNLWRVSDSKGRIFAKGTSKKRAEAQVRILNQR
jgi:hypothetical protein